MDILVSVYNQKMRIATNLRSLVSGTQEFIRFKFNITDEWKNLVTFAQFVQDGVAYNQYLDDENSVYLPAEIKAGKCTMMLYGSNGNVIGLTNYLTLTVTENALISDAKSTVITQSLYDQLTAKIAEMQSTFNDSDLSGYTKTKDMAKVAISGSYNDLINRPTSMKNPYPLTINGQSYDGSKAVSMTINVGNGASSGSSMTQAQLKQLNDATSDIATIKSDKADKIDTYTKSEIDTKISSIPASSEPKVSVDTSLNSASTNPVQNRVVYNALNNKADKSDVYTKQEVDNKISAIQSGGNTTQVADGSVTTAKIADKAVTKDKLADDVINEINSGGSGATSEQLAQIEKNAADIKSLSEEIDNLQVAQPSGVSTAVSNALIEIFKHIDVDSINASGYASAYTALETALGSSDDTTVTLSAVSATYSGGSVAVGTALSDLADIVVTATYSDGSTNTITGYVLSGEIAEGDNVITVAYGGKTAAITVTGVSADDNSLVLYVSEQTVQTAYINTYTDEGETVYDTSLGYTGLNRTNSITQVLSDVVEEDTDVTLIIDKLTSAQDYCGWSCGATDWDGTVVINANNNNGAYNLYNATLINSGEWVKTTATYTATVRIPAGMRLIIAGYLGSAGLLNAETYSTTAVKGASAR